MKYLINKWIDDHKKAERVRYFWQQHFTVEIEWRIEKLFRPWLKGEVRLIQPRTWGHVGESDGEYIEHHRP